jgi:hypothetical protein
MSQMRRRFGQPFRPQFRRIILRAGLGSRARPMAPRYSQKRRGEHWMKAMPCAGIGHDVHEIEIRFEAVRQGLSAVFATSPAFD